MNMNMNIKVFLVVGMLVVMAYPAAAFLVVAPVPPVCPPVLRTPNTNAMMSPASVNALPTALQKGETARTLLDQALQKGFDVSEISEALAKADALLEKAQKIAVANPIPASNMVREALAIYNTAISDLEALLGL
jgi:hypothetical protein